MIEKVLFLGLHHERKSGVVKVQQELAHELKLRNIQVDDLSTLSIPGHELTKNDGSKMHFDTLKDFCTYSSQSQPYDVLHSHSWAWSPSECQEGGIDFLLNKLNRTHNSGTVHTFHSFIEPEYSAQQSMVDYVDIVSILNRASIPIFERNFRTNGQTPNFEYIPNMVSTERIDDASVLDLKRQLAPNGEKLLLYVGRLEDDKGIIPLSHAFNEISKHHDSKLVIVGSSKDSERGVYERAMSDIMVQPMHKGSVEFAGWINESDVSKYQRAADVQIAPSYTEAFGLAIHKGILNGCPQIVSSIDTMDAILNLNSLNSNLALGVNPRDPFSIAQRVSQVFDGVYDTISMVDRGISHIKENYAPSIITGKYLDCYNSINS